MYSYFLWRFIILNGVRYQALHHLVEQFGISPYTNIFQYIVAGPGLLIVAAFRDDRVDKAVEGDLAHIDLDAVHLKQAQPDHPVHNDLLLSGTGEAGRKVILHLRGKFIISRIIDDHLEIADERLERRAQLMGYGGDELLPLIDLPRHLFAGKPLPSHLGGVAR